MVATPLSMAQPGYEEPSPHHALTPVSLTPPRTETSLPDTCTPREARPPVKKTQILVLIQIIYVDLIV